MSTLCRTVTFCGDDSYIYTGLLFEAQNSKTTVIHVHGSCGNFLSFTALQDIANEYILKGLNLLTFNLKGHDCIAEGNWANGRYEYVGGSIVDFNEAINDIKSAIKFAKSFSDRIILQGHSMGCERVLSYQIKTNDYYDTVLISPCNAYDLQQKFIEPNTVENQIIELSAVKTNEFLTTAYGIKNKGEYYTIPIYRDALLSIMKGYAFRIFRVGAPESFYLPIRCCCCIGEFDKLQTESPSIMFKLIEKNFMQFTSIQMATDHEFTNFGNAIGSKIASWASI